MTDIRRPSHDIRRVTTIGIAVIVLTFGVIGGWAAFAPLGSAVIGHGALAFESNRQTVAHFEGGVVGKIFVHEGDHVHANQVLLELNPIQADAAFATARNQLYSLLAKADRLKAERDNLPSVTFSDEVKAQSNDPIVASAITDEAREFHERRSTITDQVAVLDQRMTEAKSEISGIDQERAGMQEQARLLDEEISGLTTLYRQDLVPKPRLLELQRSRAELQGQIGSAIAQRAKTEETIGETQLQITQLRQQFYQDVSKDLSDAETQSADIRQRFAVAQDAARRVSIVSPVDGVVQSLRVFTVGGVVRPGEPIVDIAPDRGRMILEARFSPDDIDSVHMGQKAQLRFSTFHSRKIPVIYGTIKSVSQDRLTDEATHAAYYLAIVDVPEDHLPAELQGKMRAGLPAEVIVGTGTRTALQYIFGPLSNALVGTMREK